MDAPALQIADLAKVYPTGTEALRGVSLEIADGDFFGLLGPNGAGKSTLIHCTTGLAMPTGGSIRVFGHDAVEHYEPARLAVGLAPQDPNLDQFLTAEETLDYHAGYFGMPRKERRERTAELLETFSLTGKRHDRTRTLSGGMKRRLILARALMHRPRLLILDEPTAGVDVELRLELWHYVQRINAGGFLRGMIVATLTFAAASLLIDIPVEHILVLIPGLFLVGFFFAQLGVLVGLRAEQFDDVSFYQTFVLQPLMFLGGVFYSATLLPEPFRTLTRFDPVYYMIGLVRYGFIGYSETNVALSLVFLTVAASALFAVNHRLFAMGYRLRA